MLIGELAQRSGFSRDTIRYYEQLGLLAETDIHRRLNNYKDFGSHALMRLDRIRELKQYGFSLNEIKALLPELEQAGSCDGMPAVLSDKLADIEARIRELHGFRNRLQEALACCQGPACEGPFRSPASGTSPGRAS